MINLYFDNIEDFSNILDKNEVLESGALRITTSPYANSLRMLLAYYSRPNEDRPIINFFGEEYKINITDNLDSIKGKYLVCVGLNEGPRQFLEGDFAVGPSKKFDNLLSKFSERVISDTRAKKAFLLFDNSLEGYHHDYIFDYFYDFAIVNHIPPSQIIYVTGNLDVENRKKVWEAYNVGKTCINVIGYPHFEFVISEKQRKYELELSKYFPTFTKQYEYKKENFNDIKLYNFLSKKPREHRAWMYDSLKSWGLLEDGVVSMQKYIGDEIIIDNHIKPKKFIDKLNENLPIYAYDDNTDDKPFDYYMYNFNEQATLDSWFSIISETHFEDSQGTVFLSEKTFKTIACNHMFIVLGNKHSLVKLKELGYKTFDGIIDESYDVLDSVERIKAIINVLRNFKDRKNKLEVLEWCRERIIYNSMNLRFNALFKPPAGFHFIKDLLADESI